MPKSEDWILNSNPSARFHFKTFLVPVPFPVVTMFEMAGMYKNGSGLTPPILHMRRMCYYLLHVPPYIYTYTPSTRQRLVYKNDIPLLRRRDIPA